MGFVLPTGTSGRGRSAGSLRLATGRGAPRFGSAHCLAAGGLCEGELVCPVKGSPAREGEALCLNQQSCEPRLLLSKIQGEFKSWLIHKPEEVSNKLQLALATFSAILFSHRALCTDNACGKSLVCCHTPCRHDFSVEAEDWRSAQQTAAGSTHMSLDSQRVCFHKAGVLGTGRALVFGP